MTNIILEIDDALCQAEMLAERAGVMINDVDRGYFGQNIKGKDDTRRIMLPFYDIARVKTDFANSLNMHQDGDSLRMHPKQPHPGGIYLVQRI